MTTPLTAPARLAPFSRIRRRRFPPMNAPVKPRTAKPQFAWNDPLLLDQQLTEQERMVRDAAQAYCRDKLQPRVLQAFRTEHTDPAIFREMGDLGLLGPTLPSQYGGAGLN